MAKLIDRTLYLNRLIGFKDKEPVKILTGVRRCGKSTLFRLFQNYLLASGVAGEQIQDINFEDAKNEPLLNWRELHGHIEKHLVPGEKNYVFLDEIQHVQDFQKAVNSLRLTETTDLYLTGSNSSILTGEFATLLSGRYVEINMFPLSFKEYVSAYPYNVTPEEKYRDYIRNSSFPYTVQLVSGANPLLEKKDGWDDDQIRSFLQSIYNAVILKDIIARRKLKDLSKLERVIRFMFDNIGSETSIRNIYNTMKTDGRDIQIPTVENYLEALLDAFVLYKTGRYDVKGKQYLKTQEKYYLVDPGLRFFLLGKEGDAGRILENVVYLELLRRGYHVFIGKVDNKEVDFVALKDGNTEYYQVAESVGETKTLERELASLDAINDHNPKFLLTMEHAERSFKGIRHINALKWLME
jgi:predicted AAA+ superfamily ATPase